MLVVVHDDTYIGTFIAFLRIEIADAHAIFRDMETGENDHVHIHLCNILFTLQVVDAPFPIFPDRGISSNLTCIDLVIILDGYL